MQRILAKQESNGKVLPIGENKHEEKQYYKVSSKLYNLIIRSAKMHMYLNTVIFLRQGS
jgi:hypothetical protein